jgi:hypothetical protein
MTTRTGKKSFINPSYELGMMENGRQNLLVGDNEEENKRSDTRALIGIVCFIGMVSLIYATTVQPVVPYSRPDPCNPTDPRTVRDVKCLSKEEKAEVIRGLISMKNCKSQYAPEDVDVANAYDYFPYIHNKAAEAKQQIHGSGFYAFPWHREMQNRFHKEIQRCSENPKLLVPYMDWDDEESVKAMMDVEYLGTDGNPANKHIVEDGPLGSKAGKFKLTQETGPPVGYLQRAIGNGVLGCLDIGDPNVCSEKDADEGSADCVSWNLHSQDFPKDADYKASIIGPFMKFPTMEAPDNDKNGQRHPPTVEFNFDVADTNKNCGWENPDCFRYYSKPSKNMRLKCKHFAPKPISWKKCVKLNKFLPEDGEEVFRKEDEANPHQVAPSYYSAKPGQYWHSCAEGINPDDFYAAGWERVGASLDVHGSVHTWIGGTLAQPTAANDPIFQHLHGNADRVWAMYQKTHGNKWFETTGKAYLKTPMPLLENPEVSISDVLDFKGLAHRYDV